MKLTFQIVITDESGSSRTEELMSLQKSGDALNDIGLSVSESKQLLGLSRSRWFSNRQTNIFTRISDVLTALRSAESKANKKSNTGRCLALFLYQDFGCIGAAVKKVQQKQSVCSVTGLEITLTLH
ncbi:hypothetical protein BvCmsNSNP043_04148 [Escherichia coli]|nr:hypothetical protein BvCmsNSNP043_04148 [Escherichia coli]